ncbi:calcium-binding protein [Patulibacter minatonensis]|uniref:calcium-binding protein n=1 Tax=Patulibacter minatonensis TaxID=298163 RepID=UPI00047BDE8A|nr:calcium-binding protein [Patulibacter minatonensis]
MLTPLTRTSVAIVAGLAISTSPGGAGAAAGETIAVSRSGGTITVVGTSGADSITVEQLDRSVTFSVNAPAAFTIGAGCSGREQQVVCPSAKALRVRLGGGADRFRDFNDPRYRLTLDGGAGDDDVLTTTSEALRLTGGDGDDRLHVDEAGSHARTLLGGAGDDDLFGGYGNAQSTARGTVDGGAGDDRVVGGAGVDRIRGGARNDAVTSRDGHRDRVDCGPGRDTIEADRRDVVRRCP